MAHTSARTISRDVRLFQENLYWAEIKVNGGTGRVAKIDIEDFSPPQEVLQVWENLDSRKKPPQMSLFEDLELAVRELVEMRRRIYEAHTCSMEPYQVLPGSSLEAFMQDYSTLEGTANEKLQLVLSRHELALNQWLETEIKPLLEAGKITGTEIEQKLNLYASRFPNFNKIQRKFGVSLKGPVRLWNFKDALAKDTEAAKEYAEAAQARANARSAEAVEAVAQSEIDKTRAQAWAAEQEARAKTAAVNAQLVAEQQAYARACAYQEQQIRSAIEEKASELRTQILGLLVKNLSKIQEKNYQPGKLPPSIRADLQSLVESAQVLAQTDNSLTDLLGNLTTVQSAVQSASTFSNPDALREQVDALLKTLVKQLSLPDIETDSPGFDSEAQPTLWDRAMFINFRTPTPV